MEKNITVTMKLSSEFLDEVTERVHETIRLFYGEMDKYVSSETYSAFFNAVLDAIKYE
jgi:hypothetical protein